MTTKNEHWTPQQLRDYMAGKGDTPAPKTPRTHWEDIDHVSLVSWFDLQYPNLSLVFFHLANGGSLVGGAVEGGRRKAMGVRAGASDMMLAVPRGGYNGLFIELKATPPNDAPVQDNQLAFIKAVRSQGYRAEVCLGWEAAKDLVVEYLNSGAGKL